MWVERAQLRALVDALARESKVSEQRTSCVPNCAGPRARQPGMHPALALHWWGDLARLRFARAALAILHFTIACMRASLRSARARATELVLMLQLSRAIGMCFCGAAVGSM